ncbi:MAG: alanine:cation symporter family protein [Campylobacterales bacterium]|nr:alanine:cation symporter family protein [Campylobacterales bacterium]
MEGIFGNINNFLAAFFFFDLSFGKIEDGIPFIVVWLIFGGVFVTVRFGFVNLKMMGHAFDIIRGKYKTKEDIGEITPFQSLTAALSATVGLGNIAGVAIAISVGGPGATFWMILAGFLGMSLKFAEVTLAQLYREVRPNGQIMGGAMEYLSKGLTKKGFKTTGKVLAVMFSIFAIGGSLGAGNAFQASQALGAVSEHISFFNSYPLVFGFIFATLVGFVIIGGIKRIAHAAEAIVPTMGIIYVLTSFWIIFNHISEIPHAISLIFTEAFAPTAVTGGIIGVIIQGFKRAVFSSEAGIGSAAIVHSTATVKYPVRQGFVALYEPFVDTIIICTITALVIILTGVYDPSGPYAELIATKQGAALTSIAHASVVSWFPIVLSFSVMLFAFSTMITWSYYGERSWTYLFGEKYTIIYKVIFLLFTLLATVTSAKTLLEFSDLLFLAMALPNLIGVYVLQGEIASELRKYKRKLKSGELDREALGEQS